MLPVDKQVGDSASQESEQFNGGIVTMGTFSRKSPRHSVLHSCLLFSHGKWCVPLALLVLLTIAPSVYSQEYEQLAVGTRHICALDTSGGVDCTTDESSLHLLPPDDLPPLKDIGAGEQHSCGITIDDTVVCWGANVFGELQIPDIQSPVASLSVGHNHTCVVDSNNAVTCWGLNTNGQLNVPDVPGGFVQVSAGRSATCGIDTVGDIHCWSSDSFFTDDMPVVGPFSKVDIGINHGCGITESGDIECWALRDFFNITPPDDGPYTDITGGRYALCGLRADQRLECGFANPISRQIDTRSDEYPTDVAFTTVSDGTAEFLSTPMCGIRADDGVIQCFGGGGSESFDGSLLPPPPGSGVETHTALTASDISLSLVAEIYDDKQLEIFWNKVRAVSPIISVEVYRDDQLLTVTQNNSSYYDNTFADAQSGVGDVVRYRVRSVDTEGNVGEFSNTIAIDRVTRSVSLGDSGNTTPPPPPVTTGVNITNLGVEFISVHDGGLGSYHLSWDVENTGSNAVAGYAVSVNDELVGSTTATIFLGNGIDSSACRVFTVVAVDEFGVILDHSSVAFGFARSRCNGRLPR